MHPRSIRAALLSASALLFASCTSGHDELDHEDDYAFLQSTAIEWQSAPFEDGVLFVRDEESGRCVAGVVADDTEHRVWILLDHDTDVLRVPDEDVSIATDELERIIGFCEPSPVVLEYLRRRGSGP